MPDGWRAPIDELPLVAMEGSEDVGAEPELTGVITRSPDGGLRAIAAHRMIMRPS
jgi:hypothetical protein